ncbi:MAG: P-type conjugative transfer protein TrbL, partial [Hyphomonas sp.]|nr:P-type conjugative transfer protein TrbL [Hyphomonas sp.]
VIIGIGSTLFATITDAFAGTEDVTLAEVMGTVLAATVFLWMGVFGPGIASGLVTGAPQLGAGSIAGTAAAIGAGTVLAGAGGAAAARGVSAGVKAGASLAGGARTAYDLGSLSSGTSGWRGAMAGARGVAAAGGDSIRRAAGRPFAGLRAAYRQGAEQAFAATGGAGGSNAGETAPPSKPAWARRLTAEQRLQHAGALTVHALRDGDRGMGSASPDLGHKED